MARPRHAGGAARRPGAEDDDPRRGEALRRAVQHAEGPRAWARASRREAGREDGALARGGGRARQVRQGASSAAAAAASTLAKNMRLWQRKPCFWGRL